MIEIDFMFELSPDRFSKKGIMYFVLGLGLGRQRYPKRSPDMKMLDHRAERLGNKFLQRDCQGG